MSTEPEQVDPTQCSGDPGPCPEHGFHRESLKQPGEPELAAAPSVPADADLRERIAQALADNDGWVWAEGFDKTRSPSFQGYLRAADAVLAVLPTPADRAGVLREAAVELRKQTLLHDDCVCVGELRRLADEAEYVATPCSFGACEPGGEPCTTHERLMAHGEGDHELCEPDCGTSLNRMADEAQQAEAPRQWCKCPSCWGWFVEEHPGEDLDDLGKDLRWWSGLPEHRDAPATEAQQAGEGAPRCTCGPDEACGNPCDYEQQAEEDEPEPFGPQVVAYRNPDRPDVLLCREHGGGWQGLTPVTSDDLPDGGLCTWGLPFDEEVCGTDVLIPQAGEGR